MSQEANQDNNDVPPGCYIVFLGMLFLIGYLASEYKLILQMICNIVCQDCK